MSKRPLALFITLFIAGCSMAPDYHRPTAPVPNSFEQQKQASSLEATDWQQVFKDSHLQNLIQIALKNNRDLRVAALNVETYRAKYQIQRAAQLPTLGASAGSLNQRTSDNYTGNGTNFTRQETATLGISSYEMDFFGRIQSLKHEALETYLAQEETRRSTELTLIAEVASGYLTYLADQDLLQLSENTAKSYDQSYQLTLQRFNAGIASSLDVSQAKTNVESVQVSLATYRTQVAQDINALRLLLGADVPSDLPKGLPQGDLTLLQSLSAGMPSSLLTRRPDILAAEHTLKAANANIGAARAAFFPTISLTANAGAMSSSLGNLFKAGSGSWLFEPSLSVPIFDWGTNSANLDVAEISKRSDIATYEKTIQTAFREVADALAAQNGYHDQLQSQQALVDADRTYFELAQERYEKGIDSYLTMLDAQRSLFSAEQTLVSTRLAVLNNRITLFKTLGGGWKADTQTTTDRHQPK